MLAGGAGLVGQNLVPRLKQQGYSNLVVLDKHAQALASLQRRHPDIAAHQADLSCPDAWEDLLAGADALVMLQAQIGGKDYQQFQRNNIDATRVILNAVKSRGVSYLVHVSSSVVESVADDWYTNTKMEQEKLVAESGIAHVILRPTLMFGWFDRKHLGWLSRFMRKVPVFPVPGMGRYMRQPLYAGDFCNILISCIEGCRTGTYNISGLEKVDYIDIVREVKRATRSRTVILPIPYSLFYALLRVWAVFDPEPPFTAEQLSALVAGDSFEVIDWPAIFDVRPTPFPDAIHETFNDRQYSGALLDS